jgi:hypothetical protein
VEEGEVIMGVTVKKKTKPAAAAKKLKPSEDNKEQSSAMLTHDAFITAIKEAIGNTQIEHPDGSVTTANEIVAAVAVKGPMANVGMSASRTIPLAKYDNVKIQVSLNAPAEMTEDDINATFEFVKEWVDSKMVQIVDSIPAGKGD